MTMKLALAMAIALALPAVELLLPMDRFVFRAWEALLLMNPEVKLPGVFFPNVTLTLDEVGDLAPYSELQVVERHTWQTDKIGYRNSRWCEDPEVIVVGDSMASGIGLDQSDTLSARLETLSESCVYSFGHERLEHALKATLRWGWKPKTLVLNIVERNLSGLEAFPVIENPPKIRRGKFFFQEAGLGPLIVLYERMTNSKFSQYRDKHGLWPALKRAALGFKLESGPADKRKMIFFEGKEALVPEPEARLHSQLDLLKSYQTGLAKMGMNMIVVVVPDKESIYPELIPAEAPNPNLERVYAALERKEIPYVDLYHPYREAFTKRGKILYHLDDTHWTGEATAIAAGLTATLLSAPAKAASSESKH